MSITDNNHHDSPAISGSEPGPQPAEKGDSPPVALAGFLVAAVVFINEASFRNADQENFSVDYQVLLRLALCGGCGLYAWKYLSEAWAALNRFPAAWITIFAIWCAVTVPFAVNVPYAAASCGALWCVLLFAPVALLHLGPKRLLLTVFGSLTAFALVSWFVYLFIPPLGSIEYTTIEGEVRYRMGGLSHPVGLGRQVTLLIMAGLVLGSRKMVAWRRLAPGFIVALITMYYANTRTAMVATAAAAGLLGLQAAAVRGGLGRVLAAAALAAAIAATAIVQSGSHTEDTFAALSRSGDAQEISSFTGRTEIWRYTLACIAEAPVVGYGCGCCRFPMCRFEEFPVTHAHNVLLNVMVNAGVVGGLLLVAMFLTQMSQMFAKPSLFPDMLLVTVLVFGFTDNSLFAVVPDAPTFLWIVAMVWRPLVEPSSPQVKEATA